MHLPAAWQAAVGRELTQPYFQDLSAFVAEQRAAGPVFPPEEDVFSAFALTPYDRVKVLLLGQDPYHGPGQAHGLCFSVKPGVKRPPSLVNIHKELADDQGCAIPNHGYLVPWAEQGVLMLNAVLTVRQAEPNSHKNKGWETFTDAVIRAVDAKSERVVFLLWGGYAKKKAKWVRNPHHTVITSAHPSPLSARNGFFGSQPFSKVNEALVEAGHDPIQWCLEEM